MSTTRVPIIDKNGKATHVWKTDSEKHHVIERLPNAPTAPVAKHEHPLWEGMDGLWEAAVSAEQAWENIKQNGKSESDRDTIINAAFEAQHYTEVMELEFNVYEQTPNAADDEDYADLYTTGIVEMKMQRERIYNVLKESGLLDSPTGLIMSSRITRTPELGITGAEYIFGEAMEKTEIPDGGTHLNFGNGMVEVTVNRIGNVTHYKTPKGEFTAASIDFPTPSPTGGMELRGKSTGQLTMHDAQSIVYISTGKWDNSLKAPQRAQ